MFAVIASLALVAQHGAGQLVFDTNDDGHVIARYSREHRGYVIRAKYIAKGIESLDDYKPWIFLHAEDGTPANGARAGLQIVGEHRAPKVVEPILGMKGEVRLYPVLLVPDSAFKDRTGEKPVDGEPTPPSVPSAKIVAADVYLSTKKVHQGGGIEWIENGKAEAKLPFFIIKSGR